MFLYLSTWAILPLPSAIAWGHESVEITYRYAHLFPTVQKEMADKLNVERSN